MRKVKGRVFGFLAARRLGQTKSIRGGGSGREKESSSLSPPPPPNPPNYFPSLHVLHRKRYGSSGIGREETTIPAETLTGGRSIFRLKNQIEEELIKRKRFQKLKTFVLPHQHMRLILALHLCNEYKMRRRKKVIALGLPYRV